MPHSKHTSRAEGKSCHQIADLSPGHKLRCSSFLVPLPRKLVNGSSEQSSEENRKICKLEKGGGQPSGITLPEMGVQSSDSMSVSGQRPQENGPSGGPGNISAVAEVGRN